MLIITKPNSHRWGCGLPGYLICLLPTLSLYSVRFKIKRYKKAVITQWRFPSNVFGMSPLKLESTCNLLSSSKSRHERCNILYFYPKTCVDCLKLFNAQSCQDIARSPRVTAACWHGVGAELTLVQSATFFPNAWALPQPAFAATVSSLSPV